MGEFSKVEQRLRRRLVQLGARVDDIEHDLREPLDRDFEEQAAQLENEQTLETLEATSLAEIEQIRAALARIKGGGYGVCTICGEPINEWRLEVLPHAAHCINCAAK